MVRAIATILLTLGIDATCAAQAKVNALIIQQLYNPRVFSFPTVFSDRALSESFVRQVVYNNSGGRFPLGPNQYCDVGEIVYPALLGDFVAPYETSFFADSTSPSDRTPWFARLCKHDSVVQSVWLSNDDVKEWVERASNLSQSSHDECLSHLIGVLESKVREMKDLECCSTIGGEYWEPFEEWGPPAEDVVGYFEPGPDLTAEYDSVVSHVHRHGAIDDRMNKCFTRIDYGYTPYLLEDGRYAILSTHRRELYIYKSLQDWLDHFGPSSECY